MRPDTIITLGEFEFADTEVPASIAFGGSQALVVHQLIGGARVVDAMGAVPTGVEWSGLFRGESALSRARYIDTLRGIGKPLELTWSELSYLVVIRDFRANFERAYQIPYTISCEVVEDRSWRVYGVASPSVTDAINDDAATAGTAVAGIGDSTLDSLFATLNTAIAQVSDFAKATESQIQSVLQPLADVRARVQVLVTAAGATIQNATTLGGVLPNNPIATNAANLISQITAATQQPALVNLDRVLGRIGANVGSVKSAPRVVTTAGGDLYHIAADQYGDAMGWPAIAAANGIKDPQLAGVVSVKIPSNKGAADGVLGA